MRESMGWSWPCSWSLSLPLVGIALCFIMALKVVDFLWWRPRRLEEHFWRQGITGPPYKFFVGNFKEMVGMMLEASSKPMMPPHSHDILPRVLSFYHQWKKTYGSTYLLWFGPAARLTVADPDLIREIFVSRSHLFDRYESHPLVRRLEGEGLVSLRGEKWAHHRKLITPTFHAESLRLLIPHMAKTVVDAVEKWPTTSPSGEVQVEVSDWFQGLTEDAITRTAFGRSYEDGKAVFQLQAQQMAYAAQAFHKVLIPGYRFLPTKNNRASWKLDKQIRQDLVRLINHRTEKNATERQEGCPKDLLGLMINESKKRSAEGSDGRRQGPSGEITVHDVVEECKTFFFAGKQTTNNLLTWTTVLLAMHPEWQQLARDEVLQLCGTLDIPTRDHLTKLKTLGMILNEALRLYPPAVATIRRAEADVELDGIHIPRGTELLIPIIALHHDAVLWGPDAARFNPARFAEGVARAARHPTAFIPFGLGARSCIGQNLALLEAKLTIAIILQRFSFRLAPTYVHAPTVLMLLYPQYGAPVLFRPLSSAT